MSQNKFLLALKLALTELKHGYKHFRIFISCLILGVSVMATVNIFSAIVKYSLENKAQEILGGDIEVEVEGLEPDKKTIDFLGKNYGEISHITNLTTMLYSQDEALLVNIKAIDEKYPLIGQLILNENISKEKALADNGIIIDAIILDQLNLKIGDKVTLGREEYFIRATLNKEPDRVINIFSFGPRVMMDHTALKQSGLLSSFSLLEHEYRIKAFNSLIINEELENKLEKTLNEKFPDYNWQVRSGNDGNNTINRFLNQFMTFLNLSALSTFLIAGIGIAGSIRFYLEKKYNSIAVMKILGATRKTILANFLILIFLLALIGGLIGVSLAVLVLHFILPFASQFIDALDKAKPFVFLPAALAIIYGILISFIFSIPVLTSAANIKAASIFRSKLKNLHISWSDLTMIITTILVIILVKILIITAHDKYFTYIALFIILGAFASFALITLLVKKLASKIQAKQIWLKLALKNISNKGSTSGTVIFAIGVSLTIFITLNLSENNFEKRLSKIINERSPSLFMLDIQQDMREDFTQLLQNYAPPEDIMILPMLRGKLSKINEVEIAKARISPNVRWITRGDRGLTFSNSKPENAKLSQGEWWPQDYKGKTLISVDERMLEGMNLEIGDNLTLNILGKEINAEIANARKIDYTTFQINFAMMLSSSTLANFPHTNIATIYLDSNEEEVSLIRQIAKNFPGVTIIRTKEILAILRDVLKNILLALNITVLITLSAGLLVLTSALNASIKQRIYDLAMLKILGANSRDIIKSCLAEWIILALSTSFIAISIGSLSAWLINKKFNAHEFYLMPDIISITIILCLAIICLIGYVSNRKLFKIKPANLLRNE